MDYIFCHYLQKNAPKLSRKPLSGELGNKIYNSISQPAWDLWLKQQTILINEYRLDLTDKESQQFLKKEINNFFFSNR